MQIPTPFPVLSRQQISENGFCYMKIKRAAVSLPLLYYFFFSPPEETQWVFAPFSNNWTFWPRLMATSPLFHSHFYVPIYLWLFVGYRDYPPRWTAQYISILKQITCIITCALLIHQIASTRFWLLFSYHLTSVFEHKNSFRVLSPTFMLN